MYDRFKEVQSERGMNSQVPEAKRKEVEVASDAGTVPETKVENNISVDTTPVASEVTKLTDRMDRFLAMMEKQNQPAASPTEPTAPRLGKNNNRKGNDKKVAGSDVSYDRQSGDPFSEPDLFDHT
jgi:hypothetical protein